ncbi:hypothetical protein ACG0TG_27585, partial [Klebsiella pneumoniae]
MAPTTAQIMTENTAGQTYRATYSPDDNKLRLYASLRLDEETYSLINKAGFRWAPKQELFVAPAWTPGREDVLLSLAGDIEDEDSTLFDRQEQRAGRFSDYSDRRAVESEQALAHVDSLASAVPLGQTKGLRRIWIKNRRISGVLRTFQKEGNGGVIRKKRGLRRASS